MDELIQIFTRHLELTPDEINFLKENVKINSYPKGYALLNAGQISQSFYFVVKGCLRLYYKSGIEEKNAFFYTENMFVSSYMSFTKQIPSDHYIATIEKSSMVVLSANFSNLTSYFLIFCFKS